MKNYLNDNLTLCFMVAPGRYWDIYNAMSSMMDLNEVPSKVMLYFNNYDHKNHEKLFDIQEIRNCEIIKINRFRNLSSCWNDCIRFAQTKYVAIFNDDIVFQDPDTVTKILEKHEEGFQMVHSSEAYSAFSIDRGIVNSVGLFDENFPYSWEDADYRLRMKRASVEYFRFDPFLVKHNRTSSGRRDDLWDKSSEYFFRKWNIPSLLKQYGLYYDCSKPEVRRELLMQGFFDDQFYEQLFDKVKPSIGRF